MLLQTKQCRQTALSIYFGREDTFRTDRMPEAACFSALRGQAFGLSGDDVAFGREPGGLDAGDKFAEEVRLSMR